MMRARAMVHYAPSPQQAVAQFKALVRRPTAQTGPTTVWSSRWRVPGNHDDALDTAKPLFAKHPDSLLYVATEGELLNAAGHYDDAIETARAAAADQSGQQAAVDLSTRMR